MPKRTSKEVRERAEQRAMAETYTINGRTRTLRDWLHDIGLTYKGFVTRRTNGFSVEEALTTPKYYNTNAACNAGKKKETPKNRVYKFVRNGGGAGTWRWVEEEI